MSAGKRRGSNHLPGIIITGASGFIGRHLTLVLARSGRFRLFCLARRSRTEAGIPAYPSISWLQVDITDQPSLEKLLPVICRSGGADFFFHLASYYDFTLNDHPAYKATNVTGTRHVLGMAKSLGVRRFIFASSLTVCSFPEGGSVVTERSPPDANFPYARSKALGEEIVSEHADEVPSSVVRLAAVYSDWCEYPPLYMFMKNWLTAKGIMARVLGGDGKAAIPYIHVKDVVKCFQRIIQVCDSLPNFAIYNASPNGSVSHSQLFRTTTRLYLGREVTPLHIPKLLATLGLHFRFILGRLRGRVPFEQPWMAGYIDRKMDVDTTKTFKELGWKTTPRYHVLRRLLVLTDKMKNQSSNWQFRNELMLKRVAYHRSFRIYSLLDGMAEDIIGHILEAVTDKEESDYFFRYHAMDKDLLHWYVSLFYQVMAVTVRTRSRFLLHGYAQVLAARRFIEGFTVKEVRAFVDAGARIVSRTLLARPEIRGMEERVYDYITVTAQLLADEIEDWYEVFDSQPPRSLPRINHLKDLNTSDNLRRIVRQLDDLCGESLEHSLSCRIHSSPPT